jgi:hypothetical protein
MPRFNSSNHYKYEKAIGVEEKSVVIRRPRSHKRNVNAAVREFLAARAHLLTTIVEARKDMDTVGDIKDTKQYAVDEHRIKERAGRDFLALRMTIKDVSFFLCRFVIHLS